MADPKKNPLIGAFRAPVPGAPPGTPAPPEAGKPPAAGAAKPIDEKKGQEAPKAPAGTTPKPTDGKKGPEAPKASADTSAKPADGKKEPEAPKAPAAPLTKPTNEKKGQEAPKVPADTSAKPADGKKEPEAPKAPAGTTPKPTDGKKGPEAPKAPADTSAKPADGKKEPEAPKAPADPLTKPTNEKKGPEAPKAPADTPAKPTNEKKGQEEPKAPTDASAKPADGKKSPVSDPSKPKDEKEQEPRSPDLRFVALSKIKPLPGTYVKDEPRKDYSGLIADIKKNGLQKPVILRKSEKEDEFQLVDGFHRCKALEQAGMLEVRADVYEMSLAQASEYRKGHRDKPLMPVPGKLVPYPPEEPAKADKAPEAPAVGDEELPENLKIPLTKEGQPETVTTMKVANIRPFEGHPFAVRDNKDMWDLVDSIKKFGVLEPVMVIPHKDGGYEMVSGHRRMRACQLAGIENIPVIVRNLDRDEAIISMVDSNLKREEISPMEKARAYQMKTDAMKRKMGRRTKEEIAQDEALGIKRMNADEELAQQVGESPATIQRYKTLNKLVPELQDLVDKGKIPVNTGADIAQMKPKEQKVLADAIQKEDKVPSGTKAKELKKESQAGSLTTEKIEQAVAPTKREETPPLKVTMLEEDLRPFFPDKRTTIPDVKQGILEGLKLRQTVMERQKAKTAAAKKADTPVR
ncbi:ParB/RepB/Spo0J family partition protein [Flavonifractor plautii]|jgi:ParB/RepB/Spo0J family partition protein|uniref:ParB/RepB/Spo0J family partition protein n=3 Tax=Bacteria TaxID=2 RepID=UPI001CD48F52|nr:ParB/RepB/Spo0J family partition protein [Flavonifractor plautii]UBS62938.1 ParB/RepB/Spo0J family partition protein [Flavonifractor plautii]